MALTVRTVAKPEMSLFNLPRKTWTSCYRFTGTSEEAKVVAVARTETPVMVELAGKVVTDLPGKTTRNEKPWLLPKLTCH
jgi:hypothetical protein